MTPLVERLARVLGVWWAGEGSDVPGTLTFSRSEAGLCVRRWEPSERRGAMPMELQSSVSFAVDEPTALLALLAYARGLEVDLGPCGLCFGEKRIPMTRDGWEQDEDDEWGPCPACAVDGHPTGRDVRPLVRVLLDSMPHRMTFYKAGNDSDGRERTDVERKVRVSPGDPASRNALAVKADDLAQAGDPLAGPLAAFLGGECRTCGGGGHEWTQIDPRSGWTPSVPGLDGLVLPWIGEVTARWRAVAGRACRTCGTCRGHGTMLGALAPTLEEMAAEEWRARVSDDDAFDATVDALRSVFRDRRSPFTQHAVGQIWRDVEETSGLRLADHGLSLELGDPETREIVIRRTTVLPGEIRNITVNATLDGA